MISPDTTIAKRTCNEFYIMCTIIPTITFIVLETIIILYEVLIVSIYLQVELSCADINGRISTINSNGDLRLGV